MSHVLLRGVVGLTLLLSLHSTAMQQTIFHDDTGFSVRESEGWKHVHSYDVDPEIREMKTEQLVKFIKAGCRIRANKLSNGDYVLRASVPGLGGGAGGAAAGVFIGHALVWGSCHTVAAVASFFGTPAAGVAVETAISMGSPAIEGVAMKVGLGLGILFGVATGPV